MANPAAQAHCRCQSPHESTAGDEADAVQRSWLQSLGKGHGKIAELPVNGRELPVVLLVARPV